MSTRVLLIALAATVITCTAGCADQMALAPGDGSYHDDDDELDDDDAAGDDDDQGCEIAGTDPVDGSPSAYYRDPIMVYFATPVSGASIELDGPDGPVDGSTTLSDDGLTAVFDPFSDDIDRHLVPQTGYAARVEGPGCSASWTFSTSDLGLPLDQDVDLGSGLVYTVDLAAAELASPAGAGSLLAPLSMGSFVVSIDGTEHDDLRLRTGGLDTETMDQDLCQLTVDLTEQTPATLIGSHLSLAKASGVRLPIAATVSLPLLSLDIEADFEADGTMIREGRVEAVFDSYELDRVLREVSGDDEAYDAGTTCDLLDQLGSPCEGCPGDPQQLTCVTFTFVDLEAQWLDDGVLSAVDEPNGCR